MVVHPGLYHATGNVPSSFVSGAYLDALNRSNILPLAAAQSVRLPACRLLFMARHRAGLRLPELLHVPPGREPAAAQTPPVHLEGSPLSLLRRRLVARLGGKTAVQPGEGSHHAPPLPRVSHPGSLAEPMSRGPRKKVPPAMSNFG